MQSLSVSDRQSPENPLDDMEDMLVAANYECTRITPNRLSFFCEGRQGRYTLYLEWRGDFNAVRCSVIINGFQSLCDEALDKANEAAWYGFFTKDGAGHIVFKSVAKLADCPAEAFSIIETLIDQSIGEADRLCATLNISHNIANDDLFAGEDIGQENLFLALSEPQGSA